MRSILFICVLLLSSLVAPSVAFFNEGDGDSGSIPGIPMIPISKSSPSKLIKIDSFNINIDNIKVEIDNRKSFPEKCEVEGSPVPIPTPEWPITSPVYPDSECPVNPDTDETILGEVDTQSVNVTTQGLPPIVSTAPLIKSFTFKIEKDTMNHGKSVVNFYIRGKNFDVSSLLGNDAKLIKQLGELLEPRVFLTMGTTTICLKVCKFDNENIIARFEDIEDQKNFKAGPYIVMVKVLSISKPIGILSTDSSDVSTLGGFSLPEIKVIGPSFPVLPKLPVLPVPSLPLIKFFDGFKFDVATLPVIFSQSDADKIRGVCKVV